jgi:1,4-alpha-glucan branching enzyme
MPASQLHIDRNTPLGANLAAGGVTFRAWAPKALEVYLVLGSAGGLPDTYAKNPNDLLVKDPDDFWGGYVPGLNDGALYRFYVVGAGSEGFKRDPYARELEMRLPRLPIRRTHVPGMRGAARRSPPGSCSRLPACR